MKKSVLKANQLRLNKVGICILAVSFSPPCLVRDPHTGVNLKLRYNIGDISVQFTQSCPILCDPMDCSMPGFPVHHHLPEFAQTHVHRVGDAPTISSSVTQFASCPHLCQHQGLFQSWLFTSGGHSIAAAASVLQNTWVHRLSNPDDESVNFQGLGFFLSQMRGLN